MKTQITQSSLLVAVLFAAATACTDASNSPAFVDVLSGAAVDPLSPPPGGVAVLLFITSDCPVANGYAPQIKAMIASLKDRPVKFTLVHIDPDLTQDSARKHAADYGYDGTIVLDRTHELVTRVGVTITPEAAVYSADGKLQYRGRINNWYGDIGRKRPEPTKHELRDAIEAVLKNEPVAVSRTEAVGCTIEPLGN